MKHGDQPAFPQAYEKDDNRRKVIENGFAVHGLSKREYFAAMALSGLAVTWNQANDHDHATHLALMMADDLLKKLEQK